MASKRMRDLADGHRWDEGDARVALRAWRDSGLSGKQFAAKHGFNPQRLFWWKKRLDDAEARGVSSWMAKMNVDTPRALPAKMALRLTGPHDPPRPSMG